MKRNTGLYVMSIKLFMTDVTVKAGHCSALNFIKNSTATDTAIYKACMLWLLQKVSPIFIEIIDIPSGQVITALISIKHDASRYS